MSSGAPGTRAELRDALARELRQLHELGASFFRAAAARRGMPVTDLLVLDLLESNDPLTAGQLADLTGLTTGAITGLLNRLEEAGRVRRERDPSDGRRVIVRLAGGTGGTGGTGGRHNRRDSGPLFASLTAAWDDLESHYDEEQIGALVAFLKRSSALSRQEIVRLREAPTAEGDIVSAPLGSLKSGRLVVSCEASRLVVRADDAMAALYQARFEGPRPDVKVKEGVVTIRYPRHLVDLVLGSRGRRAAEVTLNAAIPWRLVIQGAGSEVAAELGRLDLAALEVKGGGSQIRLDLPVPSGVVPIRIGGAASDVTIRRPAGVAARVRFTGRTSSLVFDGQNFSAAGNTWLHSPGYDATASYYDIEATGAASAVTITSG